MDDAIIRKQMAGSAAVEEEIQSGMVVGLGTGTTAIWAVRRIAELMKNGTLKDLVCIPTSKRTETEARSLGLPLTTLEEHPRIDVTIDGADEIDPQLNLIKGGGGALLREKIVAQASERLIIAADHTKMVEQLGTTFQLPVEVVPFGHGATRHFLEQLGCTPTLRLSKSDQPYLTDNGNYIYDCAFAQGIAQPQQLADALKARAGIIEHGMFLQLTARAFVASANNVMRITKKSD